MKKWTVEYAIEYMRNNHKEPTIYAKRVVSKIFGSWREGLSQAGILPFYTHCQMSNCGKQSRSARCPWCEMHYYRNRRHGDPSTKLVSQYTIDSHLYDVWTTDNAWLLGLLWSDGWLQVNNGIGITNKDLAILKCAEKMFSPGGDQLIIEYDNPCPHYKLRFSDETLARRLREVGMTTNKSLTIDWPSGLPLELRWHFVRGVFDGDGNAWYKKRRKGQQVADLRLGWASGSHTFAEKLRGNLIDMGCSSVRIYTKKKKNPLYNVCILQQESLRVAIRGMYPTPDVPSLWYKRENCLRWIQTPRARNGRPCGKST